MDKAYKGDGITDKELKEVLNKDRSFDKKVIAEKEKFVDSLNDVLNNDQIVLYNVFGREMLGEAKEGCEISVSEERIWADLKGNVNAGNYINISNY